MLFNSLTFVVFFAIVAALHYSPFPWRVKKFNLLIASYLFYAAWSPPFVLLLWLTTIVDFKVGAWLWAETRPNRRKLILFLSILVNLGLLGYFKYGGFLMDNFQAMMSAIGVAYEPPRWDIIFPVGLSFYTFQSMSYALDAYFRRAAPTKDFLDYSLFVTFFPHLVAGPIVRPTQLIPQFATPHQASARQFGWGLALMTVGLFEKVVLADTFLAPAVDPVYAATGAVHPLDAWVGTLAFSGQIFFDFSGYTTTAIGAALCLGFSLPDNFRFPYAAIGFSDFWRRWHISLSTWLRDYLYVPLGGNRKGPLRTYANLMITMLLGGLWHGANWTFVVWGGLHGLYLAAERFLRGALPKNLALYRTLGFNIAMALLTYVLVNITWVFFRAQSIEQAFGMLASMFTLQSGAQMVLYYNEIAPAMTIVAGMVTAHWLLRTQSIERLMERTPQWALATAWSLMLFGLVVSQGSDSAFIYFQF
jgi:alginate O-acetyltransferase complex protein AlgI